MSSRSRTIPSLLFLSGEQKKQTTGFDRGISSLHFLLDTKLQTASGRLVLLFTFYLLICLFLCVVCLFVCRREWARDREDNDNTWSAGRSPAGRPANIILAQGDDASRQGSPAPSLGCLPLVACTRGNFECTRHGLFLFVYYFQIFMRRTLVSLTLCAFAVG